ncbi:response regulator [Ammoniphilus sp. 3BR4]|uniref:response regulator n=1 Tax=Ammoniphilus sp. 3BR4 TaxID=3158265 RepID=UPI0034674FC3
MKIKTKLLLGLSALPILIFLFIGMGWFQLSSLHKMSDSLIADNEASFLANQIHIKVKNQAIHLRNIVVLNNPPSIQRELSALQKESDAAEQDIALLESQVKSTEQKKRVEDLKQTNEQFNAYKENVISLVSEGKREEALQLINSNASAIHDEFLQVISNMTDAFETNMRASLSNISTDFQRQILISSFISLIGIIIALGFVFRSVWTIATRLNRVSGVMTNVAHGKADLKTRVEVQSHDEIDDVAHSFNLMAESLEEQARKEQNQNWIHSNMADMTTSLSGTHDLETLSRTFLSKAAPLLESCQAVFYVKDEVCGEKPVFKLLASYAFKERKHASNTFGLGEGLVGQAALEKTPIILTEVPADFIRIKSGLGEGQPLNIYVLPILYKDDVKGVLEIASFKPFTLTQQTFLEKLVSNLGIIVDSVMGRIQLAKLLEESQALTEEVQAQSEELQSQQEELRATNEELEAQTQALRQSEEKLQAQQEELEQTNAELEEKAKSLEERNKKIELTNREMEKARAELEEKARQLALSSKYKSEFLANMSHELRTPLNSLLILSKLLSDNHGGNLTEKQMEYSRTIYSSGSELLTLINDILDLAKIESGKMDVHPKNVRVKDLTEFVEMRFRPIANEKNLDFRIVLKDGLPEFFCSDEQKLQQVLNNLLSNAFKFTDQGGVSLTIDRISKPDQPSTFSFSIADTGIGIPVEKQELIFHAFQQADGTTSRKYGGTGLGLSISREMAALLGGNIAVESEEGKGSTFTFYVGEYQGTEKEQDEFERTMEEVAVATEAQVDQPKAVVPVELKPVQPSSRIKRLLIVDDDVRQRNSLMELMGDKDVIIKAVSSGTEAIEELKVDPFDYVILDLGLSDTTGFDLLEKIKKNVDYQDLKVFIYTGRDLTSKEEMYLKKYAYTIIIKDEHSPQRLMDELEFYLHSNVEQTQANEQADDSAIQSFPGLEGKKILLVDDDVRNVYALSSILELQGMNITFAENGLEALELLEKHPDFDLILMDIMMPEMDGYEATRKIRENPKFSHLPVIALTAKAMKEDREKCMEAGASDYIVKPVDPDRLISLIRVWLYPQEEK